MQKLYLSRRFVIAVLGIISLTFLGYTKGHDVSLAISGIVLAVAGANSYQKKGFKDDKENR